MFLKHILEAVLGLEIDKGTNTRVVVGAISMLIGAGMGTTVKLALTKARVEETVITCQTPHNSKSGRDGHHLSRPSVEQEWELLLTRPHQSKSGSFCELVRPHQSKSGNFCKHDLIRARLEAITNVTLIKVGVEATVSMVPLKRE